MIAVMLTWPEVHQAGVTAMKRIMVNLHAGLHDAYGLRYDSLGADIHWQGCIAEIALCKHLNVFWDAALNRGAIDGGRVEVRSVDGWGKRLMLHPKDPPLLPYVLAVVEREKLPRVALRGWIMGVEGKRREHWQDPGTGRPAFFVPNERLLDMAELQREMEDA